MGGREGERERWRDGGRESMGWFVSWRYENIVLTCKKKYIVHVLLYKNILLCLYII